MSWLAQRLLTSLLLIWVVASIVFLAIRLVPGDPAELLLSQGGMAPDAAAVDELHAQLGLDRPVLTQYADNLGRMLTGDLGRSLQDDSPVAAEIARRLPRTLELIVAAALLAVLLGIPGGLLAATRRDGWLDRVGSLTAALAMAVPVFVVGTLFVLLFAQTLHLVPAGGYVPLVAVAGIALLALLVPILPLADPLHIDVAHHLAPPSLAHLLGQDEYGRDVLSRLLWGARVSLAVAGGSSALACAGGVLLGLVGGFWRGLPAFLTLRSMDLVLCFPPLLLALLVVTLLGPGAGTLIPVLAVLYLPGFVRVVYAGVLAARAQDYVEAARAIGARPARIMLRTILPNIAGPVLVQVSLTAASAVVLEFGLSFLGLGVVPPAPSWGLMIGAARATMVQAPLLLLWPCLALSLTILSIKALCDALRDRVAGGR